MFERIRQIRFFAGLDAADLKRICASVTELHLEPGGVLFAEGETGESAYIVLSGEVEVLKATERREALIAVRGAGEVMGEMALLREQPRSATVRARTAVELAVIPKAALDDLLDSSTSASRAMFSTLLDRWEETGEQLRYNERMAQLGTLTAGVAHELNNPAAAIKRAAERLDSALVDYREALASLELSADDLKAISEAIPTDPPMLTALERSDREAVIEAKLTELGVSDPWRHTHALVDAGIGEAEIEALQATLGGVDLGSALRIVGAIAAVRRLVTDIRTAAGRMSGIVSALKSYSFLDQAPIQDVDVRVGLDETITILSHKLGGIDVIREYEDPLPTITAQGSELNQVWTNLIDNAADSVAGVDEPRIVVRARGGEGEVVVEVEDNGPGIPDDVLPKIFDAFFTTKGPGSGSGLGLHTTHRIVVQQHGGSIDVETRPGSTVFVVRLPVDQVEENGTP